METINIKGKEYVQVNERLKEFRNNPKYEGWSLTSEIIQLTESFVVIKSSIFNKQGIIIGTGIAQEDRDSSNINKTSYVENCESSSWGRALGNIGIGIDVAICSADEVKTAIDKQDKMPKSKLDDLGTIQIKYGKYAGKQFKDLSSDERKELRTDKSAFIKEKMCEYDDMLAGEDLEPIEIFEQDGLPF